LVRNAIIRVPMVEMRTVAVNRASCGMPVAERTEGFTARIYAAVMNVVRPARSSVLTVVPRSLRWKNLSSALSMSHTTFSLLDTNRYCPQTALAASAG
jgi:hypothetical protein